MRTVSKMEKKSLDIIIPVYNEEEGLPKLIEALSDVLSAESLDRHGISSSSLIFVDDGSTDRSVEVIGQSISQGAAAKIVRLSRNFGHQAAVSAGLQFSRADLAAVMDADLQDPPEVLLEMLIKMVEGYDVVYARRHKRDEPFMKRACYWAFYRAYRWLSPIEVPVDSGDFCLMTRRAVQELRNLPETLRFARGLRSWIGFRQTGIDYHRPKRLAGKSKYSFRSLYELATDGIASLSIRPLKLAQFLSLAYFVLALLAAPVLLFSFSVNSNVDRAVLILILLVLLSNGLVFLCLYVMSAYLGRGYMESKRRPVFIVAEVIDVDGS